MPIRYMSPENKSLKISPRTSNLEINKSDSGIVQALSGLGARAFEAAGAPLSSIQSFGRIPLEQARSAFESAGMPALAQMAEPTIIGKAAEAVAPTSQIIKKYATEPISELLTGQRKYTEPTGPITESLQNLAYTASAIFNPLSLVVPSLKGVPAGKALTRATVGEAFRFVPKIFGAGEKAENVAHFLGTTAAGTLGTRKKLAEQADLDFTKAEKLGAQYSANPIKLKKYTKKAIEELKRRDIPAEAKSFVSDRYQSLKELLNESLTLNKADAIKRFREINDYIRNPDTPSQAIKSLEAIREHLRDFIQDTKAPEFVRAFKESNELYAGMQSLNNLQRFLSKALPINQIKNPLWRKLLESFLAPAAYGTGITALSYLGGIKGAAIAGGAGLAANQLYKTYKLIQRSPVAQKAYIDMLAAAAQENASGVIANAKRIDKEIDKLEHEEKKQIKSKGITYRIPGQ